MLEIWKEEVEDMDNKVKNIDQGWFLVKINCCGDIIEIHIVNKLSYLANRKTKYFLANIFPLDSINFHESYLSSKKFKKYIQSKIDLNRGWKLLNPDEININFEFKLDK